ncbi:Binding protein, putative isoform 1 [Theobroma cacao]|uniref:Binding protein, putative isoform 1 n=2 Tax=Theobroma cacao TaxID=3641 RepID=A0A061DK51_THECC|nr:Binding protein, putative isoform 1 [Theobroma cacao]
MDEKEAPVFWLEEHSGKPATPASLKRKVRSRKLEFVGWGSKPLIEFLESIGKDTTKQISQHDVTDIIRKYVNDNNLVHPAKKKRILCDERLYSIFGRKAIGRMKVYDLLETHYAENQDAWSDGFSSMSDEDDVGEEQKSVISERKAYQKKKVIETPKSCFAAIVQDNIKLVYLKKSLVQDLLKDPERFEAKVVGSFVRIKSDPNYYLQQNSHQLVLVKGLKKASGNNDINTDILLQVSNFVKDVNLSMLSDDNFAQEECEDLHQRVKNGLLKRLTIVELEAKARILHEDITKHWLSAEITLLQKLIDRANEKGWRRELFEYMERRELLMTPEEQSQLLLEVPNVIAEEIDIETAPQDFPGDEQENDNSLVSTLKGTSDIPSDTALGGKLSTLMPSTIEEIELETAPQDIPDDKQESDSSLVSTLKGTSDIPSDRALDGKLSTLMPSTIDNQHDVHEQPKRPRDSNYARAQLVDIPVKDGYIEKQSFVNISNTQVIDLSDDDEDSNEVQALDGVNSLMWHYSDPRGYEQGPFSLKSLKGWKDAHYFPPDFKVWKTGQSKRKAVLLTDILHRMFPI